MPPLSSPNRARDFFTGEHTNNDEDQQVDYDSEESQPFIRCHGRTQSVVSDVKDGQGQYFIISDDSNADSNDNFYDDIAEVKARPQDRRQLDSIRPSDFAYPASSYEGFKPPFGPSTERAAIGDLKEKLQHERPVAPTLSDEEDFIEFNLEAFSIYFPESVAYHSGAMTGLHNLATKPANSWYCFDGILSLGHHRHYVKQVLFQICSIGNYGLEKHTVGDNIWIQSERNQRSNVYYRLTSPSNEYTRYHDGFIWLADLAKHFVDYLEYVSGRGLKASIHNFKSDFAHWLEKVHGTSELYKAWYMKFNKRDFRGHIAANIEFLWKEANGISDKLLIHPIWKEIKSLDYVPMQRMKAKGTIVTPYVYECFSHLKFGDQLSKVTSSSGVRHRQNSLGKALQFTSHAPASTLPLDPGPQLPVESKSIVVGDVLGVPMDDKSSSLWKDEPSKWKTADECWYVLVQGIHVEKDGTKSFDIIWLYKPSDTTCAKMKYPFSKELFLSDNCSCDTARITEEEVLCKVSINWNGYPEDSNSDFFIRQTYLRNNAFVTLQEHHKRCIHFRDEVKTALQDLVDKFKVGDTVLYVPPSHLPSKRALESGEIVEFLQHGANGFVTVRRLLRRGHQENSPNIRPNELVYSDETCTVSANKVKQKCFVRFYTSAEVFEGRIAPPYNRDGTGLAFYITTRIIEGNLVPIHPNLPPSLIQGPDFGSTPSKQRLRGLDLYCGGGNFGRGLEEGGSIHNTHAVDLDGNAIHTYWANLEDKKTKLFYGSVNDMLIEALKGNPSKSDLIPLPGDIDFISAGSPCPGFSVLNSRKDNAQGLKNQSLVASVAAYIDLYRPKYALLENVVTMAQKGKRRDEDVLSQLICCVVGMGYQVQVFNLDAWSFGSSQSRCRLFVSIAAPELEPPPHPCLSHSHPEGTNDRGLGLMASGHPFGERMFQPTPFDYVTALEATADLPDIGDGRTYQCCNHSDHRMARGISRKLKAQIEIIPINPRGMCFAKTLKQGLMTRAERGLFPTLTRKGRPCHSVEPTSHAWERIHPQKLFPTIATSASPGCARTGRCLHWDQQRLITVLEARRAQGFPDHEVLIGAPPKQWRIIGNSVARTVSLALGMSIGEACRKNMAVKQKPKLLEDAQKTCASDLDSRMVSPDPAPQYLDQSSTDGEIRSIIEYKHSSNTSVMKSCETSDEPTSTVDGAMLVRNSTTPRTHNLPPELASPCTGKSMKFSSHTSRPHIKEGRELEFTSEDETSNDFPRSAVERQTRKGKEMIRFDREDKLERLKRKRASQARAEDISSESEGMRCIVSSRILSMTRQKGRYTKISKTTARNVSVSSTLYTLPIDNRKNREANQKQHQKTEREISKAPLGRTLSSRESKSRIVISLISEDEDETLVGKESSDGNSADDEENVMFVTSREKKPVKPYVPVDNSMFVAYERTHKAVKSGINK